jgi:hypothetical protein
MPIVCSIAYVSKPLFFIQHWDKYTYLVFVFEILLVFSRLINLKAFFDFFNTDNEKIPGLIFFQSLKSTTFQYIYVCYLLTLVLIFACEGITPFLFFIICVIVSFLSFSSVCIITTITGAIRSGFFYELQGSLNNFRFLKKLFNGFVFVSIFFFIILLVLFFQI